MVRDFHGVSIHSIQDYGVEQRLTGPKTSIGYAWSLPLARRPRFHLQIAERGLRGFAKGLKEAFSSSERVWNQLYMHQIASGDARFDQRFNVYTDHPEAALAVLPASGLIELLLQCTEVDLVTLDDQVRFADPMQKNLMSMLGGTLGATAIGGNVGKALELQIPVHDLIAQILATTYQACA
jgi:hypothetical protein